MNLDDATQLALARAGIFDTIEAESDCTKAADVARMAAAMIRDYARTVQAVEDGPCAYEAIYGVHARTCCAKAGAS